MTQSPAAFRCGGIRITVCWAGQDCMTASMIAADMLSAMVQGKPSLYASLLSPSRSMLRAQLWINAGEAGKNLLTPTRSLDRREVSD